MALVLAKFCEKDLPTARVWLRSWKARGWRTGIRFSKKGVSLRLINFSMAPTRRGEVPTFRSKSFGVRGWKTAALVKFPLGTTEEEVLNCGREL